MGFGGPNDFVHILARVEFSKKFGLFSKIPIWGGIKLHEYYPPLSTILVRYFSMFGSLILYFILNFIVWTLGRDPFTAILFLISYFTLLPLLYVGRLAECFGYIFVITAFFISNPTISGISLGIAALFHPLPLLFGSVILLSKFNILTYLFAFIVCAWWYIPFVLKVRKFSYAKEKRPDKIFGIYAVSLAMMGNLFLFLFFPFIGIILGLLWWIPPIPLYVDRKSLKLKISKKKWKLNLRLLFERKPYFLSDFKKEFTILKKIKTSPVVISQKGKKLFSTGTWAWASAFYLLKRGIIVYNGLPATDVPADKIKIPSKIKVYKIDRF